MGSKKYICSNCKNETIVDTSYPNSTKSIAEFCESCGHLTDFVDAESSYWEESATHS